MLFSNHLCVPGNVLLVGLQLFPRKPKQFIYMAGLLTYPRLGQPSRFESQVVSNK